MVHGGKLPAVGSAAEYCVIGDDVAMSVPEGWSNEDAATLGVPFLTAAAVSLPLIWKGRNPAHPVADLV